MGTHERLRTVIGQPSRLAGGQRTKKPLAAASIAALGGDAAWSAKQLACRAASDRPSVVSQIKCRSALVIEAHRGVASFANTLGIGCAMRLAMLPDGSAQPPTSDW